MKFSSPEHERLYMIGYQDGFREAGINLRDQFAMAALMGMTVEDSYEPTAAAKVAYQYADAMMGARERK